MPLTTHKTRQATTGYETRGGNATPIGASANVVGTSVSAKGGYPIGWGRYCKYCVPATILVMAVSTVCLFLRYL